MADRKMTKSAGEHWVCSVLARHNWAAALTRDGLERTDILAVQTEGPHRTTIELQVMAIQAKDSGARWPLGMKSPACTLPARVVRAGYARSRYTNFGSPVLRPPQGSCGRRLVDRAHELAH